MKKRYFTDNNRDNLIHYQVPKVLAIGERYKKMNANAKWLYVLLLDRIKLSMLNEWKDEKGRYYVRMSEDKGSQLLGVSGKTFRNMKKTLQEYDLLEEERQGLTKSNKLYVLMLDYTDDDIYTLNNDVDDMLEEEEKHAQNVDKSLNGKSYRSRTVKVTDQERNILPTIKNDLNNNKSIKNKNNNKKDKVIEESSLKEVESVKKESSKEKNDVDVLYNQLKEKGLKITKPVLDKWKNISNDKDILGATEHVLNRQDVRNPIGYITRMLEAGYTSNISPTATRNKDGNIRMDKLPTYMQDSHEIEENELSREDQIVAIDLLLKLGEIDKQEYDIRLSQI